MRITETVAKSQLTWKMPKLEENPRTVMITVKCFENDFRRCYCVKQIDSIFPCVCSVIDQRRR